jgi:hypothetical protein
MQIAPIHHQHAKNRRPWILLPVVSGPWTSFVAALDKGRSNTAVCKAIQTVTSSNSAPASSWQLLSPAASTVQQIPYKWGHRILCSGSLHGTASYTFPTMTLAANLPTVSVTPVANFPLVLLTLVVLLDLRISLRIFWAHCGLCHMLSLALLTLQDRHKDFHHITRD